MDRHNFVGCPFYKDDIVKVLNRRYPNTSVGQFMRKPIRQLRAIYGSTMERDNRKGGAVHGKEN